MRFFPAEPTVYRRRAFSLERTVRRGSRPGQDGPGRARAGRSSTGQRRAHQHGPERQGGFIGAALMASSVRRVSTTSTTQGTYCY